MYMYDWLDEERISKLIPEEEIENIKASYRYIHLDDESYAFSKSPDIEIVTGFPMVREYFDDIGDLSDDFAYDVESEEEYLFCYAECFLLLQD